MLFALSSNEKEGLFKIENLKSNFLDSDTKKPLLSKEEKEFNFNNSCQILKLKREDGSNWSIDTRTLNLRLPLQNLISRYAKI